MIEVDWRQQVTMWRCPVGSGVPGERVATGELGAVVSQAVALDPTDRRRLLIRSEADGGTLRWPEISELERREDDPFNI